MNNPPHN